MLLAVCSKVTDTVLYCPVLRCTRTLVSFLIYSFLTLSYIYSKPPLSLQHHLLLLLHSNSHCLHLQTLASQLVSTARSWSRRRRSRPSLDVTRSGFSLVFGFGQPALNSFACRAHSPPTSLQHPHYTLHTHTHHQPPNPHLTRATTRHSSALPHTHTHPHTSHITLTKWLSSVSTRN